MSNQERNNYTQGQIDELLKLKTPIIQPTEIDTLIQAEHCLNSIILQDEEYQKSDDFDLDPHKITRLVLLKSICSAIAFTTDKLARNTDIRELIL